MKFRTDFVTNSSSSSFICEICGESGSGWDASVGDFDMFECINGHVLCQEHMLNPDREKKENYILNNQFWNPDTREFDKVYIKEELDEMDDEELDELILGEDFPYEVPECFCPICLFDEYSEKDMANYLLTKYNVPVERVFDEIKKDNRRRRKVYPYEYIAYVVKEHKLSLGKIQQMWKRTYNSYKEFADSLERKF